MAHLNLTSKTNLPKMDEGLQRARLDGGAAPARMRRDVIGWLIWRFSRPQASFRVKTGAGFVPGGGATKETAVAEFEVLHGEQLRRLESADGLPIHKGKSKSVFAPRASYSLYSLFTILSTHQLRHLQQARRALTAVRAGG